MNKAVSKWRVASGSISNAGDSFADDLALADIARHLEGHPACHVGMGRHDLLWPLRRVAAPISQCTAQPWCSRI